MTIMPVTRDKKAPSWPTMTKRNYTIAQCGNQGPTLANLDPAEKTERERPNWAGESARRPKDLADRSGDVARIQEKLLFIHR